MKNGTTVIYEDGSLSVIDPDISMLSLLKQLNPGFNIVSDPPPEGFIPSFKVLRKSFISNMMRKELAHMETKMLWAIHDVAMKNKIPLLNMGEVSVLDLKMEIVKRILSDCGLCGLNCRANRNEGRGECGATADAMFNGLFVHISEERPINPALNLKLIGCPLNCAFCQTPENKNHGDDAKTLTSNLWKKIAIHQDFNTFEFVGGEPVLNPQIIKFLSHAPKGFNLPIVMNCSAYLGKSAVDIMESVVDVWLPDFTFGNDDCAKRLAGVDKYWETATEALQNMFNQNAKIIVRLLVLPGHLKCCHEKVLDWLSSYGERIWISVMDQYLPFHEAHRHNDINKIVDNKEILDVNLYARKCGLRDINVEPCRTFWKGTPREES